MKKQILVHLFWNLNKMMDAAGLLLGPRTLGMFWHSRWHLGHRLPGCVSTQVGVEGKMPTQLPSFLSGTLLN